MKYRTKETSFLFLNRDAKFHLKEKKKKRRKMFDAAPIFTAWL